MFRVHIKATLLLVSTVSLIINNICFADLSNTQTSTSNVLSVQKPGDYYTDSSLPTPNPAIFPPPPPKSPYLPTEPTTPMVTNPYMPSKAEAQKLLSGYRNPSLPTPNPDVFPSPPPPASTTISTSTQSTQASETTQQSTTPENAASGTAPNTGSAQGGNAASTTASQSGGTNSQGSSGNNSTGSTDNQQSNKVSNNLTDLQKCVPGTYAFPSPVKTITTNTYYGGGNTSPPLQTYSVAGMQDGKCVVSITQSAVTPPNVQNGSLVPSNTQAPAANISKCSLSPNDLATMVGQAQKAQMGGYYGTATPGANYYTQQSASNACSSYLVVNGAAVPYKSFP